MLCINKLNTRLVQKCDHTKDAHFSIEPVYCLGLCAASPAMQVNDDFYGNMDSKKLDDLLSKLKSETHNV